jgi:hypothetical protein
MMREIELKEEEKRKMMTKKGRLENESESKIAN